MRAGGTAHDLARSWRVSPELGGTYLWTTTVAVVIATSIACAWPAEAQDATWLTDPGTSEYTTNTNWTPMSVPGPGNTAFFGISNAAGISITSDTRVGGWTFLDTAVDYTFTNGAALAFDGAGIVVDGGSVSITNNLSILLGANSSAGSASITNNLGLVFVTDSSAGSATIINNDQVIFADQSSAGTASITNTGSLNFRNSSSAGSATIANEDQLTFIQQSTAGAAAITNEEFLSFINLSSAGSATITNNGSIEFNNLGNAGSATIINDGSGSPVRVVTFFGTSSAGAATIINGGNDDNANLTFESDATAGAARITNDAILLFLDRSSAGSALITNNGLMTLNGGTSAASSTIRNNRQLSISGSADSATIINSDAIFFLSEGTGASAAITNTALNAFVDFSNATGTNNDLKFTAGSIAGTGLIYLGGGELTVGGNNASTSFAGEISDCGQTGMDCNNPGMPVGGSLVKVGSGALTLAGASIYTGPTTLEQGALIVNGSIVSDVTVNGGRLGGTGSTGAVTVNGGTLAPGNSIGTLTVNGAFTLAAASTFEVEANAAGQNDKVVVRGTVNLTGATLNVLAEGGAYRDRTNYTIIDNDGSDAVAGTFGSVSTNLVFLTPEVSYAAGDGNDVVLTLVRNGTFFQDIAQTPNENAVAGALDQFPTDNPLFLSLLTQSAAGARQAFNALSGEVHATVAGTLVDDSRYAREAVLGRMMQASHTKGALGNGGPQVARYDDGAMRLGGGDAYDGKSLVDAPIAQPLAFWTQGYGAWGTFDGDGNAATADRNLGGFISGMDAGVWNGWRVGVATGASFSEVSVDQRHSGANTKTYHLGGYVTGDVGGFALRGGGLWAWTDIETSRAVVFPGFYERQKADYDADTGQLFGEIAYPTQIAGLEVEPFAGLAYVSLETSGFREKGGAQASLRSSGIDQDVGYTTVGLRAAKTMMWGNMEVTPHIEAAWLHAFDDVTPGASLAFATTGIGFDVDGVPLAEDSALLDAGVDFALSDRLNAGVSYSGQYADSVSDNAVKGRLTWLFN